MKLYYNIASRAAQSNAVNVNVLKILIVHGDSVRGLGNLEIQCRLDSIMVIMVTRSGASSKVSKIE